MSNSAPVEQIIDYENGDLEYDETVELFASLIKTGEVWILQGHYGRTAVQLIDAGIVGADGTNHLTQGDT